MMAAHPPRTDTLPQPAGTPPPRRGARTGAATLLPVGTEVWYRMRTSEELIPATVVDTWTDEYGMATTLLPPRPGTLHLEIELDPQRHHAAGDRGLRQHVPEGAAAGSFCRDWPDGENAAWAMAQLRRQILHEENVRRAQGRTL